jgi:hypothetical protein
MKNFEKIIENYLKTEILEENYELIEFNFNSYGNLWYKYRDNSAPAHKRFMSDDSNVHEDFTDFGTHTMFAYMISKFAELNEKIDKLYLR